MKINDSDLQNLVKIKVEDFIEDNGLEVLEIKNNTRLIGATGIFDSIDLVSFIVELEEAIEDEFDVSITLTDEKAMSRNTSPFINIETLINFIKELLDA